MEITKRQETDGIKVITLKGKLDVTTSPSLEEVFNMEIQSDRDRIIIDMTNLSFITSGGIRVLLIGAKKVHPQGRFVLCNLQDTVQDIMNLSGLAAILEVVPSLQKALAKCRVGHTYNTPEHL